MQSYWIVTIISFVFVLTQCRSFATRLSEEQIFVFLVFTWRQQHYVFLSFVLPYHMELLNNLYTTSEATKIVSLENVTLFVLLQMSDVF